jgi:hypothetical protein
MFSIKFEMYVLWKPCEMESDHWDPLFYIILHSYYLDVWDQFMRTACLVGSMWQVGPSDKWDQLQNKLDKNKKEIMKKAKAWQIKRMNVGLSPFSWLEMEKNNHKIGSITGLGPCRSSRWTGLISVMTISKSSQCLPHGWHVGLLMCHPQIAHNDTKSS